VACLPTLANLLFSHDDEVLADACWAVSYLSDGSNDKIQAVIDAGIVPRLVELLAHPSVSVQTPALRSIGNIVSGDDNQTQAVIAASGLQGLLGLLTSPKEAIRKEVCWSISNITAGSPAQVQAVVRAGLIAPLIEIVRVADFRTRKEACWALSNATACGLQDLSIIRHMVEVGYIACLCDLLNSLDNKVILVTLDGLENVLRAGEIEAATQGMLGENAYATAIEEQGGLASIHSLQQHENIEIYKKTYQLMDTYFPDDDDDDDIIEVQPTTDGAYNVSYLPDTVFWRSGCMLIMFTLHSSRPMSLRLRVGSTSVHSDPWSAFSVNPRVLVV
jgi:importin subunit alpha-6/7